MRIYPAPQYTMGGLWVDYHLMSTIPGLFVGGEANFSDHGANRLGASALMQGFADGYFILRLPCPITSLPPSWILWTPPTARLWRPSFLEMLDALNEDLSDRQEPPIAFEHDCREGICGSCGFLINGVAHGGQRGTTVCQLAMRFFKDGDTLTFEPWRARAFPVIRDLIVNRSAFDRIIQAGGHQRTDGKRSGRQFNPGSKRACRHCV